MTKALEGFPSDARDTMNLRDDTMMDLERTFRFSCAFYSRTNAERGDKSLAILKKIDPAKYKNATLAKF